MSLRQEIAQLCQIILTFQRHMIPLKQQLFNLPILTRSLVWNHVVGSTHSRATISQIVVFFRKHGLRISKVDAELLIRQFSTNQDGCLTCLDFWQIFKPLTIKMTEQIMKTRQKRLSLAKFNQAHFKISDLLCLIMQKTIDFIKIADDMKKNIVQAEPTQIKIQPLDPSHLQIYLHQCLPDLQLKDARLIFQHIIRNEEICQKTFESYFIPIDYKGSLLNPNYVHETELAEQLQGIQLMKYHFENVHHVKGSNKKKLYLLKQ